QISNRDARPEVRARARLPRAVAGRVRELTDE
ncbi:uncharacterized, partial [Tachysurus ichikawai]